MKKRALFCLIGLFCVSIVNVSFSQTLVDEIKINEFMAANSNTIKSPDYQEYADWIELFNGNQNSIDIGGCYLTDDFENPQKWQIPTGTIVQSGQVILFWADSRNEGLHTNFNLSRDGEVIGLFSFDGSLLDTVSYSAQVSDISRGRYPDGTGSWFVFENPTPGLSNSEAGYLGQCSDPIFSKPGGFYSAGITIGLQKGNNEETLRYTTDGSFPNESSPVYQAAGFIDKTTVLRVRAFREGYLPGNVITETYFINESTNLPVVSVATDPDNLWSDESGIYVEGTNGITGYCSSEPRNWNQQWEIPVSVEYYQDDRNLGFKIDAGMQIGGGCTRLYPQKSLAIYARSEYGYSDIAYPMFKDKPITSFNNLLLRNGGQDWWRAIIRDGLVHNLVKDEMDIEWQAYKPAIVFLNGIYWGIHGIREKHNEHYLAGNYGIDPDAIDILTGNATVKQGSAEKYTQMIDFIKSHSLDDTENYRQVEAQMDIGEYLNYVITEIYSANIDWPAGNIKYWRQQGENHKWRWILFDTDLSFGAHPQGQYDSNNLVNATSPVETYYANPPWSTFLLRSLLENSAFKNHFIQKFASHLSITFAPQRVQFFIDSLKSDIEDEIPRHIQKWEKSTSFNDGWNYHINVMNEFAEKRPEIITSQLKEKFNLNGTARLNISYDDKKAGSVFVEDVKIPSNNFSGTYFKEVPIQCKAVPSVGYQFAGWQGISDSGEDSISFVLTGDANLSPVFELDTGSSAGVKINEVLALNENINTDENGEHDDWIELYNGGNNPVNIGGMYITDNLSEPGKWQIPETSSALTTIEPGSFLLLWADNDPEQGVLHLDFRLSANGEEIGLSRATDSGYVLLDSLKFGSQVADVSFGRYPDGSENMRLFNNPTPGESNLNTGIESNYDIVPEEAWLSQNYPNPFNGSTRIQFYLVSSAHTRLSIFDIRGKTIAVLVDRQMAGGFHTVLWFPKELASGQYYLKLSTGSKKLIRKIIYLK